MTGKLTDIMAEDFQLVVDQYLERNKNILDTLSKLQTAASRLSRAVTKSSTQCGCVTISGEKASPSKPSLTGTLCDGCRDAIEKEMGDVLFYLAGLCNTLDLSMYDIMLKEKKTLDVLGNYSLK